METKIRHDENGWWAEDNGATTQCFASEEQLRAALAEEGRLRARDQLSELAVPADSPLEWEY